MTQTKHERFRELMARQGINLSRPHAIARREGPRECEASYAQGSIWINQMLDPANTAYNILLAMKVEGPLSHAAVSQVLQTIVDRHEALRTCFKTVGGKPHQTAADRLRIDVRFVDLAGHEDLLPSVLIDLQHTKFSLDRRPLFAFTVLRLASHLHVVAMVLHHIVFDFVSSQVLCDEFGQLYSRYIGGLPNILPELRVQYLDCSEWQRRQFEESSASVLNAWKETLGTGDAAPSTDLAGDVRFMRDVFEPGVERFTNPPQLTASVARLSRECGVSAFCVWLAAFQLLLHRYTDADEIVLCVPHAQRDDAEIERLVGCFINMVVVRLRVRRQDNFRDILRAVRDDYLDAIGARACPFDKVIEAVAPTRREGVPRLGEIAFAYQRGGTSRWTVGPLTVSMIENDVANAKLAFSMSLYENADQCRGLIEFNAARFSRRMARQMAEQYRGLLSNLVSDPDRPIGAVSHIPASDTTASHTAAPPATTPRPPDQPDVRSDECLHLAFERQARAAPDAAALVMGDVHLTYRALDRRANQLARRLIREGVGIQDAVGLRMRRGIDAYICALAIFKAGAVYVPMDPSHPAAYALRIIDIASIGHVIVEEGDSIPTPADDAPSPARTAIALQTAALFESSCEENPRALDLPASGVQTAYVYFTSGSTGDSKGVFVSHGAIAAHMRAFLRAVAIRPTDRVLQFAALTFDVSLEQIFSAWLSGAALLPRGEEVWSVRECLDFFEREQTTVANPPTAYWNEFVRVAAATGAQLPDTGLRYMIAGGEAMHSEAARRWSRMSHDGLRLVNAYGPTEAVVTATCHEVTDPGAYESGASVPIGTPLDGVTAFVLDRHGQAVPAGAPGELCVGGDALADGYLKNPRMTAERFRPAPGDGLGDGLGDGASARLYRTGDWVRQSSDRVFDYLSRKDDETKIRGVRVTTTRIESVLLENEDIAEAAVVVRDRQAPRCAAPVPPPDDESVWRDVLARLPSAFVESSLQEAEREMLASGPTSVPR